MKTLLFTIALLLQVTTVFAAPKWEDLASGQHSFKTLGEDFYVDVPVRRMQDSLVKLSFVNRDLVRKLGLDLPADPAAAEEMLKNLFAWEVDPEKKSSKKWFATHYQDSNKKGPGEAQGDGRALWTGELKLTKSDGSILYVDGVQKGVGPTPFAWTNNASHSDGKQNTNELIISGIRSMADLGNNLDSTGDILGFTIIDSKGDVRSMTLRVGRQTRPAHIRYHDDNARNEKKMMDYIVARDLGLPVGINVTDDHFLRWQINFALNNAEDTARVFALNGFYEHPTMGNKTTTGGSIDLNGRQYLDAYHANMHHLYGKLFVKDQIDLQKGYIGHINAYLKKANYRPHLNKDALTLKMKAAFDEKFKNVASEHFLINLGLENHEIEKVPKSVRLELFEAVNQMMRAQGNEPRDLYMGNNGVIPAAFDTRKIIRGTMAAIASANRDAEFAKLYTVDYKWNTTRPNDHLETKKRYEDAVERVIESAGNRVKFNWIANAIKRNKNTRFDASTDGIWDRYAHPIRQQAEAGESWVKISEQMEKAADLYVDADRPTRYNAMLKPKVNLTPPSCRALFKTAG